jgi:hypothetical protein
MFNTLNQQMSFYTTTSTLTTTTAASYSAYHPSSSGWSLGSFFGQAWHDVTSWGSDIYTGVESHLQSWGAPVAVSIVVAGIVVGLYYIAVAVVGTAAAAA